MEMTNELVEQMAYRLIRKEANRLDKMTDDSELGNYVRGVVDMQTEFYKANVEKARAELREE